MKWAWLLASGALLSFAAVEQVQALAGHGHGGAGKSKVSKPSHEAPKHAGGKPAPHAAPKPPSKPHANPPQKPAPTPHAQPNNNAPSSHGHDHKSTPPQHGSNPAKPNVFGSNDAPKAKDDKAHEHHDRHHWHHDRWWHGHHQYWSEEGFWVDGATGQPVVAAEIAGPGDGSEIPVAGPMPAAVGTGPQIHFSVDPSERDAYDAAAQAAGMSRAEWIRSRLNEAVRKELK